MQKKIISFLGRKKIKKKKISNRQVPERGRLSREEDDLRFQVTASIYLPSPSSLGHSLRFSFDRRIDSRRKTVRATVGSGGKNVD